MVARAMGALIGAPFFSLGLFVPLPSRNLLELTYYGIVKICLLKACNIGC